jgi:hypothetical protein
LSRKATVFVHRTDKPRKPIAFGFGTLRSWVDLAFRSDASLPRLYQSMAIEGRHEGIFEVIKSFAWAYGVLIHQKCFNIYDKISLTLNLLSVPANQHIIGLPVKSNRSDEDKLNVNRILNILAILQKDFSLLLVNHHDLHCRWPPSIEFITATRETITPESNFTWAGIPMPGDKASERWHAKRYDFDLDPEAHVSDKGLLVTGLVARI